MSNYSYGPSSTPRPSRGGNKTVVLVIIGVAVVGMIGMCGFFALIAVYWGSGKEEPVTAQDRRVVFQINELADWVEGFEPDPNLESTVKTKYLDNSFDIAYEYDDPAEESPYLASSVAIEKNVADAVSSYSGIWGGVRVGTMFGDVDVEFVPRDDLMSWGDKSEFVILKSDGAPFGNMFVTRKGTKVFFVIFGGVYFDDPVAIRELLTPVLRRLDQYGG